MNSGERHLSQRPNILWLCTDQQRYDMIGALGNAHVSTPNIDRLVQEGMAFERAYCQSPICTPSRVSFLTGMYASAIHVNGNGAEAMPTGHPPLVTKLAGERGIRLRVDRQVTSHQCLGTHGGEDGRWVPILGV